MIVASYLKRQGYALPDTKQRDLQKLWLQWYRGFVEKVHVYHVHNGQATCQQTRRRIGMAKTICEDYGSLLINEHVQITAEGFDALPDILRGNDFMTRMNRLAELTMALGTGAVVEFAGADGQPVIDYYSADRIYPLAWDGENVTECAFASQRTVSESGKDKTVWYVQIHHRAGNGWQIRNVYLNAAGKELPLPPGMMEDSPVSPLPLFQLVRPNTVNVSDFDSPLGASVFANALEQLEDCDIVWDSYINEFVLGKKRLMVPMSLAKIMMQKDGTFDPIFDPNDALFYVYEGDAAQKPIELDMTLRTDQHDQGLQRCLDILSKKCGLGTGRYKFDFDQTAVKTATEVISEKSDLYQSLKRHEKTFGDAIIGMVRALAWLCGLSPELDVTVNFDDSIIEDVNATIDRAIKLQTAGLMSRTEAIMSIYKVAEDEAVKRLEAIKAEERVNTENVSAFFDMDEEDEPDGGDAA